jgi:MYXO-CTERM domain-containing protein
MIRHISVVGILLVAAQASAGPISPSSTESAALKTLAGKIPGARVLWVRGDRIYEANAAGGFATKVVTQGSIIENNPRFSPDGTQILTVRSDGVYVMKSDFSGAAKVIGGGHTASWTRDGKSITAVDSTGYKVLQYDLAAKSTKTIYDAKQSPYNGQQVSQAAELRNGGRFLLVFRLTPAHTTEIVDLQLKTYISNQEMERGDCSPAWAPGGGYILNTARTTSRPVVKADFSVSSSGGSVTASKYFVGLDTTEKYYIHGQRVSNDGKYVAFGGIIFGGSMQSAKREIYVWRIGDPDSAAVRISFDTLEDASPDLYIGTAPSSPKLALSPTSLSFTANLGGTNPGAKTVAVSNSGGGTLAAVSTQTTYGSGSGWLKVTTGGSGNSQSLANAVDVGGLGPGSHGATVKVSASGASNSPQSYSVSLDVKCLIANGCCTQDSQCDDGDACTNDSCSGNKCQHSSVSGCCTQDSQCNDKDPCTADSCAGNKCQHSSISGCCTSDSQCDDGNVCTNDSCSSNKCTHSSIGGCCAKDSDCADTNPCTQDSCDTASGKCSYKSVSGCCVGDSDCDDSAPCTADTCSGNTCQNDAISGCCTKDSECDDSDPCTADSCSSASCKHSPVSGCCSKNSQCDDSDPCTTDVCSDNKCQHSAVSGCCTLDSECDDGTPCTADVCTDNKCEHSAVSGCCSSDADCADTNPCTTDSCDAASGTCSNEAVDGCCAVDTDCDDADPCTLDRCAGGACQHDPVCGDGGGGTGPEAGADAGASPFTADRRNLVGGCAVSSAPSSAGPLWPLLLLALLWLVRRRRYGG